MLESHEITIIGSKLRSISKHLKLLIEHLDKNQDKVEAFHNSGLTNNHQAILEDINFYISELNNREI